MIRSLRAGSRRTGGFSLNVFTDEEIEEIHIATLEVLQKTGLEQRLQKHLVFGQNVGQAFQYSQQGAVDLAFVAFSLALSEHGRKGKTWLLPEALPVVQKGCTLKSSANRESVHDLIAYLQTEQAKNILAEFGYE